MTSSLNHAGYNFTFRNEVFNQLETQSRRSLYAQRPDIWAKDMLGVTLWSRQAEVALSIVNNKNTMVAAGHGVGKSFLTAVLALWWIDVHPIGEARVISTAPTTAQVRGIIWREMQVLHKVSRERHAMYLAAKEAGKQTDGLPDHALPGYITSSATWRSDEGIELGSGRTPPRGREGDSLQGLHGGVFAIADEAVGVSSEMIDTLANNTTEDSDRRLLIANPTNPKSAMGQIWHDPVASKAWNRIKISVLDSPKFTDEWKHLPEETVKNMVGLQYVEDKKIEYGEDSANFKARVLGEWAMDSGMNLFSDEILAIGQETTVIPDEESEIHFGFDVARSEKGDFSHVYMAQEGWVYRTREWIESEDGGEWLDLPEPLKTEKRGIKIRYVDSWRGLPFMPLHDPSGRKISDGANERVDDLVRQYGATELRIDADGMGVAMVDAMHDVCRNEYALIRMKGGDPSPDRNGWFNQRAYQYSELARRMRLGEIDIDPADYTLIEQLSGIEYKIANGFAESILIESKQEMRKKGLKSPDAADAAWYASAQLNLKEVDEVGEKFQVDMDEFVREYNYFYDNYNW